MKIKRPGSPPLFALVCVVMFFAFLKADQVGCIRAQPVRVGMRDQAALDRIIAEQARLHGDDATYRAATLAVEHLKLRQLKCPLFFPQVRGR